jgi:DNA repair photolyase
MAETYNYSNPFQIVAQMKSGVAINPSFGCMWDCSYCIQHKDEFYNNAAPRQVHKARNTQGDIITPEDIVSEIMVNPRITSRTP